MTDYTYEPRLRLTLGDPRLTDPNFMEFLTPHSLSGKKTRRQVVAFLPLFIAALRESMGDLALAYAGSLEASHGFVTHAEAVRWTSHLRAALGLGRGSSEGRPSHTARISTLEHGFEALVARLVAVEERLSNSGQPPRRI